MFQTRFKSFKRVQLVNLQNTFIIFVANICTALYSQRVANSRKKISGKYQPPYMPFRLVFELVVSCQALYLLLFWN